MHLSELSPMSQLVQSIGLLILRVSFAGMMLTAYGWPHLSGFSRFLPLIGDPIHIGPYPTLVLVIFAEFFCSVLVILGIGTRLAVIPLICAMLVAAVVVHGSHPFDQKEKVLLYLAGFVAVLILGGGGFSLDRVMWKWASRGGPSGAAL